MSFRSRLASLARNLVFHDRVEHDVDEELRSYIESATAYGPPCPSAC